MSPLSRVFFVIVLLVLNNVNVSAKRRRKNGKNPRAEPLSTEGDDVIRYKNDEDLRDRVEKVKQKIQQQRNEDKVDRKVMESKVEALKAGISAYRKNSKEQINHLHELGKWLYKLENFEEALSVSISILRWNSAKFGPDSIEFAKALGNTAVVLRNLNPPDWHNYKLAMKRSLYIHLEYYGKGIKSDLQPRFLCFTMLK
jgi:hypothetical protein